MQGDDWNEFKHTLQQVFEDTLEGMDEEMGTDLLAQELTAVAIQTFIEWQEDDNPGGRIFTPETE